MNKRLQKIKIFREIYRMPNPWIEHVRRFAEQKGVTYACALSDPRVRDGYVSSKGGAPKTTKMAASGGGGGEVKPKKVKIVVRPKSEGGGGGGASVEELAALGRKELKVMRAADAIQHSAGEDMLAKLIKRNKQIAAALAKKKAGSGLD